MKNKKTILAIFILIFFIHCSKNINTDANFVKNIIKITILYSNSSNNYLEDCKCPSHPYGGIVRRATLINKIREKDKNVLLFDSGDMLSAYEEKLKSEYTLKCYEYLKYDAICIGDQEFINGIDFFKEKIQKLPIITANFSLYEKDVCYLAGNPFKIIKVEDINIGVMGIISKNAFKYYSKEITEKIKVDDSVKTVNHFLKLLKEKCDINILLSHSGLDEDKQLAKQINGIDIIIGGHTQNLIKKKLIENDILIVQAGKNGEHLGELNIFYDKDSKKIVNIENQLHLLDEEIADDPYIRGLIEEYIEKEME